MPKAFLPCLRNLLIPGKHVFVDPLTILGYADLIIALRQLCPESVADQIVHFSLGLLFVCPVIQFGNLCLYFLEKRRGDLLYLFDLCFGEVVAEQHIIEGQFLVAGEPLSKHTL